MTIVVDASVVVAALIDGGPDGVWAEQILSNEPLVAPHLMPVEAANILRRSILVGDIGEEIASIAHKDLLDWRIELFPYEPFAERIWSLRRNVTTFDAWYVALAEELGASLVTLDTRLSRATGPRCQFRTPPLN